MEILCKLFGSNTRVKLMRLFLFNQENAYTTAEVIERSKSSAREVKKELGILMAIGLVKKRPITREVQKGKGKKMVVKKITDTGYSLDPKFPYFQALKNLLITASLHADDVLVKRLSGAGKIKFLVASGLFIQEWDTRVDLLVVGDELNMTRLDAIIKTLESEVGREISYSAFETPDFQYRYGIYDRLIRDILDLPHVTLVDKLGIEEQL